MISGCFFDLLSKKVISNISKKYQNVEKGLGNVMGGKILEYEAKDILNQGIEKGIEKGIDEGKVQVFINMIKRGFSVEDAQGLAEISDELVKKALSEHEI